ncbi:MAG: fructose-bisphosphatase class III, partial [Chloroflexia bacterium]|nr:fructose-bisphosphatase class III [Chloroflexia bacterium]
DPTPHTEYVQTFPRRLLIGDTDTGTLLRGQLEDLRKLVAAYREGVLIEQEAL